MHTQSESPSGQSEADKKDLEFAKEFWTLGNVITGFSILQALAFASSVGPHRSELFCATFEHKIITGVLILAFSFGYFWAVSFCYRERERLLTAHSALSTDLDIALKKWQSKQKISIISFLILSVAAGCSGKQQDYDKACVAKRTAQSAAVAGEAKSRQFGGEESREGIKGAQNVAGSMRSSNDTDSLR